MIYFANWTFYSIAVILFQLYLYEKLSTTLRLRVPSTVRRKLYDCHKTAYIIFKSWPVHCHPDPTGSTRHRHTPHGHDSDRPVHTPRTHTQRTQRKATQNKWTHNQNYHENLCNSWCCDQNVCAVRIRLDSGMEWQLAWQTTASATINHKCTAEQRKIEYVI